MCIVLRWAKAFDNNESCYKDGIRSGRSNTPISEINVEAVKAVVSLKLLVRPFKTAAFTPFGKATWVIEKIVQGGYPICSTMI